MIKTGKILRQRHRLLIVILVVIAIIDVFLSVKSVVDTHNSVASQMMSESQFDSEKQKQLKHEDKSAHDDDETDLLGISYQTYKTHSLGIYSVYQEGYPKVNKGSLSNPMPGTGDGSGPAITTEYIWIAVVFAFGILVAVMNAMGGFDRFLVSLGKSRQAIYWHQFGLTTTVTFSLTAAIVGATVGLYYAFIPNEYVQLSATTIIGLFIQNISLAFGAVTLGFTLGFLIGRPLILGLIAIVTPRLVLGASSNLFDVFVSLFGLKKDTYGDMTTPGSLFWQFIATIWVLTIILVVLNSLAYQRKSMEKDRLLITVPSMRWAYFILLAGFSVFAGFTTNYDGDFSYLTFVYPVIIMLFGWFWPSLPKVTRWWRSKVQPRLVKMI